MIIYVLLNLTYFAMNYMKSIDNRGNWLYFYKD